MSRLDRPLLSSGGSSDANGVRKAARKAVLWFFGTFLRFRGRALRRLGAGYAVALLLPLILQHVVRLQAGWTFAFIGGALGAVSSALVLAVHGLVPAARRHPNTLLAMRAAADMLIGLRFLFSWAFNQASCSGARLNCTANDVDQDLDEPRPACLSPSVILTFAELSSEMWFVAVSLDLFFSLRNPLTNYARNTRRYGLLAWGVGGVAAVVMATNRDSVGLWAIGGTYLEDVAIYCWFRYRDSWKWDWSWSLFYIPLALSYLIAFLCMLLAYYRLRVGLPSTLQHRVDVLVKSLANLLIYSLYWLVIAVVYFLTSLLSRLRLDSEAAHTAATVLYEVLMFLLASKGWADLVVWVVANDPREIISVQQKLEEANVTGGYSAAVETDLRPQVNEALLGEMKYLISSGIRRSMAASADLEDQSSQRSKIRTVHELNETVDDVPSTGVVPWPESELASRRGTVGLLEFLKLVLALPKGGEDEGALPKPMIVRDISRQSAEGEAKSERSAAKDNRDEEDEAHVTTGQRSSVNEYRQADLHAVRPEDPLVDQAPAPGSGPEQPSVLELEPIRTAGTHGIIEWILGPLIQTRLEFCQYKKQTFARVRQHFGVSDQSFSNSFRRTAKERLTDGGASESFFFYSGDLRYMAKNMTKPEKDFLVSIAEDYADYVCSRSRTFLTRICGLFRIRIHSRVFYFYIMENILNASFLEGVTVDQRYDIKGSWINRNYTKPRAGQSVVCRYCNQEYAYVDEDSNADFLDGRLCPESQAPRGNHAPDVTLKDNDLNFRLRVSREEEEQLLEQLRCDTFFLFSKGLMDYSLLLGIHEREYTIQEDIVSLRQAHDGDHPHQIETCCIPAGRIVGPACYFIGLVDILQRWNLEKKVERWIKTTLQGKDPRGVSSVEPEEYRERFMRRMSLLFNSDDARRSFRDGEDKDNLT